MQKTIIWNSEFMLLVLWHITLDGWIKNMNINLLQVYPATDTYGPETDFFKIWIHKYSIIKQVL